MPKIALTGSRIRDRRLALQLKQADLAKSAGVSASYLNLIEHNRRRIGGKLLVQIADVLGVEPSGLSEGADVELVHGLETVASQSPSVEADRVEEFVGRFPGWAAKLTDQNERIDLLERSLRGLNDRLTHDPVLTEKMHDVLGAVAAIRSTSSILVDTPTIDAEWRARFHANIDVESRRLAETSESMAAHFDQLTKDEAGYKTPLEAIAAFFEIRQFHIAELEEGGREAVEGILANAPEFEGAAARSLGRKALSVYAKDAARLPLNEFSISATEHNYDPAAIARAFDVGLPRVFRRLATLPRAPDRPEIGLVICDAAGAILLRKQPLGFSFPRFGAACPLWPLFGAMRSIGAPQRTTLKTVEGAVFKSYSVATLQERVEFDAPLNVKSHMLLVSADPPVDEGRVVGSTCRMCAAEECGARREASILTGRN